MKIILFIVCIIPLSIYCQVKGDNLITIYTDKTATDNYKLFGNHLIAQGYTFENTDDTFYSINTNFTPLKNVNTAYSLAITFVDTLIYVRPVLKTPGLNSGAIPVTFQWTFSNASININKQAFDHFNLRLRRFNHRMKYSQE